MQREEARKKALELVEKLTLEEMASQLRYDAPAIERLNIPEYNWWNEGLHGVARAGTATVFPQAIALAATFDTELLRKVAEVVATEGRAKYNESSKHEDRDIYKGLTYWSPNVNIFRDPRWGRGHETYGEDPFLTGELGVAFIKGLQGEDDGIDFMKLAACAKHFAVHSGPEGIRHSFDAKTTEKDLWETYLPAFEKCVKEGNVEAVMGAYNRTNGEVCCAHSVLMKEILRGKWDFQGHYVSDCWAIRDFHEHHFVTKSPEESVQLALEMGCDLNCGCTYQKIMSAVNAGLVDRELVETAAVRLFTARFMLGMFEHTPYDDIPYEVVECKEHLAVSKRAEEESIVLLKNDGVLPIDKSKIKTIGVIGPNANSRAALIGNYYGTSSRYITVLEGIQETVGDDVRVLYSEGADISREKADHLSRPNHMLSEAATVCEHSDIVILCLGLNENLEGEEGDEGNNYASGDKEGLELPKSQLNLLDAVIKTGKPFVLCMMAGSSIDMNLASEHAAAILQLWYPGARGGKSVADVLFGKVSPSGKLPITIYRTLEGMPAFEDYSMTNRTYRHLSNEPLYPFGYGLSYGKAAVESVKCSAASYADAAKNGATLDIHVENVSDRDISEVVQVYIKVDHATEVKNHRLCGFARVSLAAGEKKELSISLPPSVFHTINENGESISEGSGATLFVGFGQPDKRTENLTKNPCVTLEL